MRVSSRRRSAVFILVPVRIACTRSEISAGTSLLRAPSGVGIPIHAFASECFVVGKGRRPATSSYSATAADHASAYSPSVGRAFIPKDRTCTIACVSTAKEGWPVAW